MDNQFSYDIGRTAAFAAKAHGDQRRKYTGEPYIVHPLNVAALVSLAPKVSEHAVIAAILHDVIEDTSVTFEGLKGFNPNVVRLVSMLTDPPAKPGGPNRAARKKATRERFFLAQGQLAIDAHTIKCADLLDNAPSIREYDPKFYKVFKEEALDLLRVLVLADGGIKAALRSFLNS